MRVLITCWAWPSHYLPLAPVLWALQAAGHEVRVASQPRLTPVITASGGVAVPVGPDLDHETVRRERMPAMTLPSVPDAPAPGESTSDWSPARKAKVRQVFGVFTAYTEAMIEDLLDFARQWRPELVIHDPTTYAGPLVAAALGVPSVRHVHGVDVTYQARELVPELIEPVRRRLGLPAADPLGVATLDPCPPAMQISTGLRHIPVRYLPYNGPAVLPDWLHRPADKPRICLTWGTSTSRLAGAETFRPPLLLEQLAGRDREVVVSLAEHDLAALGPVPPGVRAVAALPLHLLLPHCQAIVHQGGNGTLLTAGYHGVPQVVLPQLPDQRFLSAQLAATGAGRVVAEAEVGVAVEQALADPGWRAAAAGLRAEILAQPAPAEVVPELVELVSGSAPG
ncbi:DUF1205 domain-containing protein [Crossiella sp. SN42]|uniref:nucleotide disphospho-sugar-binding domain-containing protein n=1 Tax=Crossiella sp. SN42 TaxID=2944808 RepID=UPI00207C7B2B|nr:nucleotide disphospho-sugar-binding domain-containing protein [Crossiella sp. SN42]MCO1580329.1 DUF1205 domain-containing protein [Crossiella sp. SN42]